MKIIEMHRRFNLRDTWAQIEKKEICRFDDLQAAGITLTTQYKFLQHYNRLSRQSKLLKLSNRNARHSQRTQTGNRVKTIKPKHVYVHGSRKRSYR